MKESTTPSQLTARYTNIASAQELLSLVLKEEGLIKLCS